MKPRILVINPNCNDTVTRAIEKSLEPILAHNDVSISCMTLDSGPPEINTDTDIRYVTPQIVNVVRTNDSADAFVIACYTDAGLEESRANTDKPVFGIQESAIAMSATYGRRFGVLALSWGSIQRDIAYVRQLGCQDFHAGERPLDVSVDEAANNPEVLQKIIETGRQLIDEDGAETLVLGCAGLSMHRKAAQQELGVPMIDPVEAAVKMAVETLKG